MARINNQVRKENLAVALAIGETVKDWSEKNHVKLRTAYAWAASPEVAIRSTPSAAGRSSRPWPD